MNQIKCRGLLLDIDGVFYVGNTAIDGAVRTIDKIKASGLPCRFCTNTTTKSLKTLYRKLRNLGFQIEKNEIISAPQAAIRYLQKKGNPSCFFCVNNDLRQDFAEFQISEENPDFIVIGDINQLWDYPLLNHLFRMIIEGSEIIALHKGRYWQEPDGLYLDIGAFVSGLEYATGKTATTIGKPSTEFFHLAIEDMDLSPREVIMVGDDIVSDIRGAQRIGMKTVLVKTGKYRANLVAQSNITPDAIIESVAQLDMVIAL